MSNAVMHGRWIKSRWLGGRLETWMNRQWRVIAQSSREEGWLISQVLQKNRRLIHPTKCLCVTDSGCVHVWGHIFVSVRLCCSSSLTFHLFISLLRKIKKITPSRGMFLALSFSHFEAFYSSSSSPQISDFGVRVIFCIHRFTPLWCSTLTHQEIDRWGGSFFTKSRLDRL